MRSAAWVLGAAWTLACATNVGAQDINRLRRHADSLFTVAAQARGAIEAFDDSVRRARPAFDSISAPPLVLLFEPALADLVPGLAREVADTLSRLFGESASRIPAQRYLVREYVPASLRRTTSAPSVTVSELSRTGKELLAWHQLRDRDDLRRSFTVSAIRGAFMHLSRDAFGWMGSNAPIDTVQSSEWAQHRLQLLSSPASIGARCYQGDVPACRKTLRLEPTADPSLEWFDDSARRRMVMRNRSAAERADPRTVGECEAGSDSACIWVLRNLPPGVLTEPVHASVRFGLARLAVELGRDGAIARFVDGGPGIEERLVAAAQLPMDTLLLRWNRRIRETRTRSSDLPTGIVLTTLLWVGALGGLSLRSSRWR